MLHWMCRGVVPGLLLLLSAAVAACSGNEEMRTVRIGSYELRVEIADSDEEQRRGLMFREELPAKQGMLFVFDREAPRSFWMRNTSIPLSIAYIDAEGRIVSIHDMEPFSEEPVPSRGPAQYALEVNQGEFARNGVGPGDTVQLPDGL